MNWRTAPDADDVPRVIRTGVRGSGLDAASARVVRRAWLPPALVRAAAAGLVAITIGYAIVPIRDYFFPFPGRSETVAVLAVFLILGGLTLAVTVVLVIGARTLNGQRAEAVLHAWLCVGRCPACTYPIASIRRDDDGAVRCPECAARWVLPRPVK